jgi:methyltransferase-like protein/ubiquinone/menaquinone biosynthesis C-methylase UbiE
MQPDNTPTSHESSSYDAVPYQSHSYAASHPRKLSVVARLFGLSPVAPSKAKILEIGCASGGNLLPIAAQAPNSTCVGIDASARQIADGQRDIAALGLKNITLEQRSVADITPEFGQFDYIICHGVFSWVSPEIQKHIMRVAKENLSPNGIVYISYNTLPGWNSVKSLRDMMLYHAAQFSDPETKVTEAIRMLRFALQATKGEDTAWRRAIEQELKTIESVGGWYIYHDHLEGENNPVYFHQIAQMASDVGLQYAGESLFTTMYVGNLPKQTADTLRRISDLVRQEQYMDFVRNRRFRMSLLTHANHALNLNIPTEKILDFHLTSNGLTPDFDPTAQDWSVNKERSFGNGAVTTQNRSSAMMLLTLHECGDHPIAATKLVTQTTQRLNESDEEPVKKILLEIGTQMLFHGRFIPHESIYDDVSFVSEKPEAWPVARYQAATYGYATTLRHDTVGLNAISRELIPLLDGTRNFDQIVDALTTVLVAKGANFALSDTPITDETQQREVTAHEIKPLLQTLCAQKLFCA